MPRPCRTPCVGWRPAPNRHPPLPPPAPVAAEPATKPDPKGSPEARLQRLQELYKKGLLDRKEYEAKKAEILKEL